MGRCCRPREQNPDVDPDAAGAGHRCPVQGPLIGMIERQCRNPDACEPPYGDESGGESRQRNPGSMRHGEVGIYLTLL